MDNKPHIEPVDPTLPQPKVGGCFVRNADGSLARDTVEHPELPATNAPQEEP